MALLANRVRAASSPLRMTSRSCTPWARAAARAMPKMRSKSLCIRAADLDLPEAGRSGAVARAHHLLGLTLAAVRDAPESPVFTAGNGGAGIPELGRDTGIARILE